MKKALKIVLIGLFLMTSLPLISTPLINETGQRPSIPEEFDWMPVVEAIIQVESGGDDRAVNGRSCGAMQITPVLVKECNLILEWQGSEQPRYTLEDRFSREKTIEMFLLVQSYFNPSNDVEKAIRRWNGGPKYSMKATQRYFEKVMARMG